MQYFSLAQIGDCFGTRFLYQTRIRPDCYNLGRFLAWLCNDSSLCVKAYKDGHLVMRKALRF